MGDVVNDNYSCSLCFFRSDVYSVLVNHYLKSHRNEPNFSITCKLEGCGGTFTKYNSFTQHIIRKHQNHVENILFQNNEFENDLNDNLEMIAQNDNFENEMNAVNIADQPNERAFQKLEFNAAKFIVNVKEICKVSQSTVEYVVNGSEDLFQSYLNNLIRELNEMKDPGTNLIDVGQIERLVFEEHSPNSIFGAVRTKALMDKFLIERLNMIPAQSMIVGSEYKWKKRKIRGRVQPWLCEVNENAYVVPFLNNLKSFLKNQDVRSNIDNPRPRHDGVYRSALDGSYYTVDDEFFRSNEKAIAIIFYQDDVSMTSYFSGVSKEYQVSIFYWMIANIYPENRSSPNTVQLYAIAKTKSLKKPGVLDRILEPFVQDILILKSDGVDVEIGNNITKNYKGSLLFCAGDTPAAAMLGGFKQSVSAYRLCRSCMVTNEEWQNSFRESDFESRDRLQHEYQLEIVTDMTLTKPAREFWKRRYGVNCRSALTRIIDVTKCIPQDIMHIVIEGPLKLTCKLFLRYLIQEIQLFTVQQFNDRIKHFNFGHFDKDKPAPIQEQHLADDNSLRQSAGQMITLAHTLLFLIAEWTIDSEHVGLNERIDNLVLLLQHLNLSSAFEIHEDSVALMELIIARYFESFKRLYPNYEIPKDHFMIHIPKYVRLFGPARQQWCFRFEATHAYFKSLLPIVKNFKNIALTFCHRYQARMCSKLSSGPGRPSPKFLYDGDYISPGPVLLLQNLPNAHLFREFVNQELWETQKIMRTMKIIIYGTRLIQKSIVLLECTEEYLPVFGQVEDLYILNDEKILLISELETVTFNEKLNAYNVRKADGQQSLRNTRDLIFLHPLSSFRVSNRTYVPLINHEHVEFY